MAVQLSNKIRILFFLTNLLYMAFGAVMFSVGVYSIVNLSQYGFLTQGSYFAGAAIFVAVGVLKILFGLLGILVLFLPKKPIIAVYVIGVIVLMMFTFIAAIYGFLRRPEAYDLSLSRLNDAFDEYSKYSDDITTVQDNLGCCGVNETNGTMDYMNRGIPMGAENCSEYVTDSNRGNPLLVLPQGCHLYLTRAIQQDLYVVGAIGMGFATAELTGLLITMQNFEGL